ncbi:UDP-N-acetylmuramoyl-L-alanine--D-glutamate ligase [Haliovirga abyssi]|uniref:UDP-N-acetylmuramoylalanine--D-glutamate ligase n=1 Tax=Haliovirga abyssi TaxID=2996794 RepID=A0AAU9D7P4_9FUSO|nr:UDP-N-acetylmuramoyl-L-alanine--D-glutamate ligase [Haliovirga abyssi]BDU49596.1 UDP-N-acetylmuramoylalanine--D-glutamate ligase [Haliovirga abyssi]
MKKVLVYGNGKSGKAVTKLLNKKKYIVDIIDDRIGYDKDEILKKIGNYEFIVKSPGISNENLLIDILNKKRIKILDETEVAAKYIDNSKIIAITGTNGKTTTTTKITEMLNFAGYKAISAGNIGVPFSEIIEKEKEYDYIVLELSSYQLEYIDEMNPFIAMVINLTPDHMNRYESLESYYSTKFNIFKNQTKEEHSIINLDDENSGSILKKLNIESEMLTVTKGDRLTEKADLYVKDDLLFYKNENILDINKLTLKGIPNLENTLFIVGVAKIIGIKNSIIKEFLYNNKGLEHRMEEFLKIKNTVFINDSKGTNTDSTIKALQGYKERITLICGGKDKKLDLVPLCNEILRHTKEVYLIGETKQLLEKILIKIGYDKNKIYNLEILENVIKKLKENLDINKKNIVVFSPAASSFDQFNSFEERGKIFKKLVMENFMEE